MTNKGLKFFKKELVLAFLFIAIYISLVGLSINKFSVWHDEGYTATLIESSYTSIIERTSNDVHPPLYYLLLKLWSIFFGDSILALRLFSSAMMLGAILVIWRFLRRHYGINSALFALFIMSIAPFLVRYGQEMRMYALAALLASLATLIYGRIVLSKKYNAMNYVGYGLLVALGFLTQYFFILVPATHFLHFIYISNKNRTNLVKSLKPFLISILVTFVLVSPWLPTVYRQYKEVYGAFWIGPVSVETLTSTPIAMTIFQKQFEAKNLLGLIAAASLFLVIYLIINLYLRRKDMLSRQLLFSIIVPPILLFIISMPPFQPSYQDRYMSFFAPIFYSSLALGVISVSGLKKRVFIGLCLVLTLGIGQYFNYKDGNNHGWSPKPYFTMKGISEKITESHPVPVYSTSLWTFFDAHTTFADKKYSEDVRLLVEDYPTYKMGNWSAIYGRDELIATSIPESTTSFWVIDEINPKYPVDKFSRYSLMEEYEYGYVILKKYQK